MTVCSLMPICRATPALPGEDTCVLTTGRVIGDESREIGDLLGGVDFGPFD